MNFAPQFTVTARLLRELETIADLKAKIGAATSQVVWTPQLAKESRQRSAHASTAIEGNPLTFAEVRAIEGAHLAARPWRAFATRSPQLFRRPALGRKTRASAQARHARRSFSAA